MMILYDFEINDYPKERQYNDIIEKILSELRVFVMQRLRPLSDDMAVEEQAFGAFSVIYLEDRELFGQIEFIDYSENLTEKLKNCLTDEDVRYIHLKILEGLSEFGN